MTRIPEQGRFAVEESLFDQLKALRPALPSFQATKATLTASSHLVEAMVYEHDERCAIVSGFQQGRNWAVERERYLELAGRSDVIAVFAGGEPPLGVEVDHVGLRLRTGDPLAQEWFVLAIGPGLAITLCGLDGDAHTRRGEPVLEADRLFDVIWSVQPHVAAAAAAAVVAALRRSVPEQADAVATRLQTMLDSRPPTAAEAASTADRMLAEMVQRMELFRLRERRLLDLASAQRRGLLSRMSHELRTPLNAILGFGQLLELEANDGESRASIAQILLAGRQLAKRVEELMDIGRLEAGELQLTSGPVEVSAVVAEVLAMLRPLADERGLTVRDETAGRPCLVLADPARLSQVLVNLVGNAVKYNREGGDLVVTVQRSTDGARVSVRDTGDGMSSEQTERLFMPFERLDAEARGIEGTGLGLVVAQQLVEAMRGTLEMDSREGVGTTVTVALPYPLEEMNTSSRDGSK